MKRFPPEAHEIGLREVEWLEMLGPNVCPLVLSRLRDGYVMEELQAPPPHTRVFFPALVLEVLEQVVWSRRDALHVPDEHRWAARLKEIFGVEAPKWVVEDARRRTSIHGDPTFSNVLLGDDDVPRLIDPCHRDYTPQTPAVDVGKVVQSCLGWEFVQSGWEPVAYALPAREWFEEGERLRLALFWAGVHARRIATRESGATGRGRSEILEWAAIVQDECWRAAGYEA